MYTTTTRFDAGYGAHLILTLGDGSRVEAEITTGGARNGLKYQLLEFGGANAHRDCDTFIALIVIHRDGAVFTYTGEDMLTRLGFAA